MLKKLLCCSLVFTLCSCGWLTDDDGIFRDRKNDYKKAKTTPRMEIPPNLDGEAIVDYYVIPQISPYAEQESFEKVPLPTDMIGQADSSVKVQKMSDTQWVLLQIPASRVWPRLKEFISLQGLSLTIENSRAGLIEASKPEQVFRFQVEQGFQRNTSELSIRFLFSASDVQGFWPETSSDPVKEVEMMEKMAQFFAEVSDKPAYSFAAQGISTQKKLLVETQENGNRALLLNVNTKRALVSIKQGLEKSDFTIENFDSSTNSFAVQYTPQVAEDDQPGALARMFGFKLKPFDEDIQYAGNNYLYLISESKGMVKVVIQIVEPEFDDKAILRKERNKQLLLLKAHIH